MRAPTVYSHQVRSNVKTTTITTITTAAAAATTTTTTTTTTTKYAHTYPFSTYATGEPDS